MTEKPKTNRRDFLTGRSAAKAAEHALDRGEEPASKPLPYAAQKGPGAFLMELSHDAMATTFTVYLNAGQHRGAEDAALECFDLIDQLEDQMTVYRSHSEISQLNARAATEPVRVEARLYRLLSRGIELYHQTGGAFDMTAGQLSRVWGFYRRQGQFPQEQDVQEALKTVGSSLLELDEGNHTVRFQRDGVEVNLGAIGKGYALDRCREILQQCDVKDFLIHGGQSSLLGAGTRRGVRREGGGWSVAVRHPLKPSVRLAEVWLRDRGLGTSGSGTQFFYHQGRRFGHVLDPRTGWPAERVLSATVLAPDAADADALATAFYVMGVDAAERYCEQRAEVSALLVCPGRRRGSIQLHAIGLADEDWNRAE